MGISAHEVTLDQLADEVAQVYQRCGFDRDATVSTLQMLTNIEVHLACSLPHSSCPSSAREADAAQKLLLHCFCGHCCLAVLTVVKAWEALPKVLTSSSCLLLSGAMLQLFWPTARGEAVVPASQVHATRTSSRAGTPLQCS